MKPTSDNLQKDTTAFILELVTTMEEAASLLKACKPLPPKDTEARKAFAATRAAIISLPSGFLKRWKETDHFDAP